MSPESTGGTSAAVTVAQAIRMAMRYAQLGFGMEDARLNSELPLQGDDLNVLQIDQALSRNPRADIEAVGRTRPHRCETCGMRWPTAEEGEVCCKAGGSVLPMKQNYRPPGASAVPPEAVERLLEAMEAGYYLNEVWKSLGMDRKLYWAAAGLIKRWRARKRRDSGWTDDQFDAWRAEVRGAAGLPVKPRKQR